MAGSFKKSLHSSPIRLTRSLSALETWGFGLSGLLLWLGTAPGMHLELGIGAIWVWLPGAIVGILLNLQVKHLGTLWQNTSGGTPNYITRLLKNRPRLAKYAAVGYLLGWVSVPPVNAIILTDLIKANLEPLGIACPELVLEIGFTAIPFVVAFSGTRALSTLHLFFVLPAIGFLLLFCIQGLGWLAFHPASSGVLPMAGATWSTLSFAEWAKWFFVAVYAVYGCETASSFVADSRQPRSTLQSLSYAAILLPIVYLGGSWLLTRLAYGEELQNSAFLTLTIAAQPFWGQAAPMLVTFLIASGCLLSSATAISNCPRILYQMSLDGYLAPVFAVVSRRGVLGPSLALTGLLSLVCLVWGDVTRLIMVTGTGYLISMIAIHWGMWIRRRHPESRWARWSLVFCLVETIVLVVGGLAWSWQDLLIGMLFPIAILLVDVSIRRSRFWLFQPEWWIDRYQVRSHNKFFDLMLVQICVLILLVCGATTIGWATRGMLGKLALSSNANLFVVLLLALAFVGVAIACWTSLPQVASTIEAREAAEHLFNVAQDAIVVVNPKGVIINANPAAQQLLRQNVELTGTRLNQFLTQLPDEPDQWKTRSEQSFEQVEEVKILEVSISDRTTQDWQEYVVILRDISERKQTESCLRLQTQELEQALRSLQQAQTKLVQSEKMSGLGQLVAGVAHEINNPVNFISGNLDHANEYTQDLLQLLHLYRKTVPNPSREVRSLAAEIDLDFVAEDLPKLLNSMRIGADRIQKIVASLRVFSRMDEAEFKKVDIHEGIDSTLMILQNRFKAKSFRVEGAECYQPAIEVHKDYGKLPLIECYAGELNQVFMNILSNAIDALDDSWVKTCKGGNRAIASPSCQLSDFLPCIHIHTQIVDSHVRISIANNGFAIPESVQSRLFEPFFTTKPVGKGTGLGLSISYDIITKKHGGQLYCTSSLEHGTEFVIDIPIKQPAYTTAY